MSPIIRHPETVIEKSEGSTPTERRLAALGYQTFLRLWSYPNPFKLQPDGKELCDLLVVFDNNIIIFSDKDCACGDSGNDQVDWQRWYKRAIQKSAKQLIGAMSWIRNFPERIAVDAKCSKKLPLNVSITKETKFYLVAVAHGVTNRCIKYYHGGDGGLRIDSSIVGKEHIGDGCIPFSIGQIADTADTFIHVFDDASYENVLKELDTVQDFLRYLDTRKNLLLTKYIIAGSENDILAHYLKGVVRNYPAYLQEESQKYSAVIFEEGSLDEVKRSEAYKSWRHTIENSYFWDRLLQRTFYYIENGLSATLSTPTIQAQSEVFKRMAREDRMHRCFLSDSFLSFLSQMKEHTRGTRIIFSPDEPDMCYILFLLPREPYMVDDDYRLVRQKMLEDYCVIAKADYPQFSHIIGVAHESLEGEYTSEDFVYLDASQWTDADQKKALATKKDYEELHLLAKRTTTSQCFTMGE